MNIQLTDALSAMCDECLYMPRPIAVPAQTDRAGLRDVDVPPRYVETPVEDA